MNYAWHALKKKRPQHLLDGDGKTLCQTENTHRTRKNSRPYTVQSETPAPDRAVCQNCLGIAAQNEAREPDLAVLMGERLS